MQVVCVVDFVVFSSNMSRLTFLSTEEKISIGIGIGGSPHLQVFYPKFTNRLPLNGSMKTSRQNFGLSVCWYS